MTIKTVQLEIVSTEAAIFSGKVKRMNAVGIAGGLGIYPGHCQLLTSLKPGQISIILEWDEEEIFYISGGILEVQPEIVTVLADTALRAADLDAAAALAVKEEADRRLSEQKSVIEYSKAMTDLAETVAQLRATQSIRRRKKY